MEEVAADAAAARHLAAARDGDIADLGIKADANRAAINALGVQTAGHFDGLERRFDGLERRFDGLEQQVGTGFVQIRGKLDEFAAAQQHIVRILSTLIQQDSGT
jgi:hypothetical protein